MKNTPRETGRGDEIRGVIHACGCAGTSWPTAVAYRHVAAVADVVADRAAVAEGDCTAAAGVLSAVLAHFLGRAVASDAKARRPFR